MKLLILSLLAILSRAQYPRQCNNEQSLADRECCPVGDDGTKCCFKRGRGRCSPIAIEPIGSLDEARELLLDERREWPTVFFDFACECTGNFDGVACEKCKHGYEGENCEEKAAIKIRKNVLKMSNTEKNKLIQVIDRSKHIISDNYVILTTSFDRILTGTKPVFQDVSIYDLFAWMHYYSSRDNLRFNDDDLKKLGDGGSIPTTIDVRDLLRSSPKLEIDEDADYAHEGPGFLPWHRYFLIKWEQEIREYVAMDDSFMVPYWDWTQSTECDVCTNELMGGNSQIQPDLLSPNSLFSDWQIVCTAGNDYILKGRQCATTPEGPLLRNPGNFDQSSTAGIPTEDEVESTVLFPLYDTPDFNANSEFSFRNIIEGFADPLTGNTTNGFSTMHNAVHLYMNGTMSEVGSSANDPVFILHHAFIDSLYERWLVAQNVGGSVPEELKSSSNELFRNGHRHYDFMVPFFPLVRNIEGFSLSQDLGYAYEYLNDQREDGSGVDEDNVPRPDNKKQNNPKIPRGRNKQVTRSGRNKVTNDDRIRFTPDKFNIIAQHDLNRKDRNNEGKQMILNLFLSKNPSASFEEINASSSNGMWGNIGADIKAFFNKYSRLPTHHRILIALYFVVIAGVFTAMFLCLFCQKYKTPKK